MFNFELREQRIQVQTYYYTLSTTNINWSVEDTTTTHYYYLIHYPLPPLITTYYVLHILTEVQSTWLSYKWSLLLCLQPSNVFRLRYQRRIPRNCEAERFWVKLRQCDRHISLMKKSLLLVVFPEANTLRNWSGAQSVETVRFQCRLCRPGAMLYTVLLMTCHSASYE